MSYQLLLVDDEVHAIEGVKSDLDLAKLNINQLFIANNVKQAREILLQEHIDILLCDIEMPKGSGLELLSWIRDQQYSTVTIFLTSHADFRYAKEALQLGSMDYLLKPVLKEELEQVITKAQQEIDKHSEMNKMITRSHQLWTKHHSLINERFWIDIINQTIPANRVAIREQIELHQLPITDEMKFLPILISIQQWNKKFNRRDEKIMEYALKNSAEEMLLSSERRGMFFYLERGQLLGILSMEQANHDLNTIQQLCHQYIQSCNQYFYCDLSCYIGQPVEAYQMAIMTAELSKSNRNNVAEYNRVFVMKEQEKEAPSITLPEMSLWLSRLKSGNGEQIIREIEKFIEQHVRSQSINAMVLNQLWQDLVQAIYSYLHIEEVQVHKLFGDEQSIALSMKANYSVRDLLQWASYAITKAINHVEKIKQSDTVVQSVQKYIAQNIDQELSRESIADMVFLNPDHLSRLFKKETGLSISEYILRERINKAKELLGQKEISVGVVSASVGYTNFSHFARIFKKYVGVGPSDYRNKLMNGEQSQK